MARLYRTCRLLMEPIFNKHSGTKGTSSGVASLPLAVAPSNHTFTLKVT